jgi:hypothetical protein
VRDASFPFVMTPSPATHLGKDLVMTPLQGRDQLIELLRVQNRRLAIAIRLHFQ